MKRALIYNLWMLMIGWSLYLNKLVVLSLILLAIELILNFIYITKINYWRFGFVSLLISLCSLLVVKESALTFNCLIVPFLLLISMNVSYINEISYKLKMRILKTIDFFVGAGMLIFLLIAAIIPNTPLLPNYKTELFVYIALIFSFPFVSITTCLIYKKIKYMSNKRMNIILK